jgi:predicted dehydrogenase
VNALTGVRPHTPDPMAAPPLRWGVLGTGWIAERFVASVRRHTRQVVAAVGSRSAATGARFAARHGIAAVHDYRALAADPGVDVVYVATPHTLHREHALLAIDAGTHVLVEKPFTVNAREAEEVTARARAAGVYCAEALWTFFLPRYDVVRQILSTGTIGPVRSVLAEYGEHLPDEHRIMDPGLAGGSLLDLGTYPVALASWLLGAPRRVHALGEANRHGVNAQTGAIVQDGSGAIAVLHTGLVSSTSTTATIAGTLGAIELPGPFYQPGDVVVRTWSGGEVFHHTEPAIAHDGLHFEAAAVAWDISAGRTESPLRPPASTIAFLRLMDAIRDRVGVAFPGEA